MSEPVTLELTAERALVLFDWLTRFNGQDREDSRITLRSGSCGTSKRCSRRR